MYRNAVLFAALGTIWCFQVLAGTPVAVPALQRELAAPMRVEAFREVAARCAPTIDVRTLMAIARTESSLNPYAIGVVGGALPTQPRSMEEALAAIRRLTAQGRNFSLGLGQINVHNLPGLGETPASILEPCRNLQAAARILGDCYARARKALGGGEQGALRGALSCYYSNNFTTGFKDGYVATVIKHLDAADVALSGPTIRPRLRKESTGDAWAIFAERTVATGTGGNAIDGHAPIEETAFVRIIP